jgi:UPF0042 nucleotide-binding protein
MSKDTPTVTVMSFGYKEGAPPSANLIFDVRFLKNPFWIEHLRPLTGKDKAVQDYVLGQKLATDFLKSVVDMLNTLLPKLEELEVADFSIAFGCTGGQHRSTTLAEALGAEVKKKYPQLEVIFHHRELDQADSAKGSAVGAEREGRQTMLKED